jgi:hypothetical protein
VAILVESPPDSSVSSRKIVLHACLCLPSRTAHHQLSVSGCAFVLPGVGKPRRLQDAGLYVDVDASARTVPKRIRAAQVAQYNLIVVVGDKEKDSGTVSVRCRDASTLKSVKDALGWNDSCDKDETLVMTAAQLLDVCSKLKAAKL